MFSSLDIKPGNITIQTKDLNSKLTTHPNIFEAAWISFPKYLVLSWSGSMVTEGLFKN